jgi:hypothetical protein
LAVEIQVPESTETSLYRVELNLDQLDLDGDSLTWTEEAAHGSSDYCVHSDGGLVSDGIDVKLLETNPADPADDPLPADRVRVAYAQSGLFAQTRAQ